MKDTTSGIVNMLGERMSIMVRADCVTGFSPHKAMQLPHITGELCKTLCLRHVAKSLLLRVRIGDTVALVDKNTGYTYRLLMGQGEIQVLGIYDSNMQPENPASQVLILVNEKVLELVCGLEQKAVAA